MQSTSRRSRRIGAVVALVATLALPVAPTALGDDWARDHAAVAAVQELDPAIRTAVAARGTPVVPVIPAAVASIPSAGEGFAWGAAALGLGAGIVATCALLGCVTLVRSDGRLRSA